MPESPTSRVAGAGHCTLGTTMACPAPVEERTNLWGHSKELRSGGSHLLTEELGCEDLGCEDQVTAPLHCPE